jgi:hypothetical protein
MRREEVLRGLGWERRREGPARGYSATWCGGQLDIAPAHAAIAEDWIAAYRKYYD